MKFCSFNTKMKNHIQNQKLEIVATIIIIGFVIAVFYHYFIGVYLGRVFPFNTFLCVPWDVFMDFFNNYKQITSTGHGVYTIGHDFSNYFIFLPYLFHLPNQFLAYVVYAGIFILYLFCFNYFNIKKHGEFYGMDWNLLRNSFVFTLMTYPVLFALDRGNCEMYIFIIMSLSMLFYYKKKYLVSAILLGLAVHTKIYYAVFLLLYFADKKYREIGVVILLFFILPFISLFIDKWLFSSVQFSGSIFIFLKSAGSSENSYNSIYVLGDAGAAYCSSLYGAFKGGLYLIFPNIQAGSPPIQNLFKLYFPVSLLYAGITALYIIFIEKEEWRKVALVTFSLILFPFVTGDYRLIMLFIPLWMFINSNEQSRYNVLYAILFGLLLIPKDYYIIRDWISISVIINPILIIIFMTFLINEGLGLWAKQNSKKFRNFF